MGNGLWWLRGSFGYAWSSHAAFMVGGGVSTFVTSWWIAADSGSAVSLGVATIAWVLPPVLIGPIGGIVADRCGRKTVFILCAAVGMVTMLVAAWVSSTGELRYWHLYAAIAIRSVASAVQGPAMVGLTAELVGREELRRAAGLTQTLSGAVRIGGPVFGAVLVGVIGLQGALATDAAACGLSALLLAFSRRRGLAPDTDLARVSRTIRFWPDFKEGLRTIWRCHGLIMIVVVATVVRFFAVPGLRLLPLFVNVDLKGGAPVYAILATAQGSGMVCGGVFLSILRRFRSSSVAASGLAISSLGFGLVAFAWYGAIGIAVAVAGAALIGVGMPLLTGCKTALIQSGTPRAAVARVMSLHNSVGQAAIPVGVLVLMPLAEQLSARVVLLLAALASLTGAAVWKFHGGIRRLEEGDAMEDTSSKRL